jgi:two-component system, chemotaxis family, sensor kinase CheA
VSSEDEAQLQELLAAFEPEAREHLQQMTEGLLQLERCESEAEKRQAIETIFRQAHSLKGSAKIVELQIVITVCHPLESLLAEMRSGSVKPTRAMIDLMHITVDFLSQILTEHKEEHYKQADQLAATLEELAAGGQSKTTVEHNEPQVQLLIRQNRQQEVVNNESASIEVTAGSTVEAQSLLSELRTNSASATKSANKAPTALADSVKISSTKLDALLLQAEEMLAIKQIVRQRAADIHELSIQYQKWKEEGVHADWKLRATRKLSLDPNASREALAAACTKLLEMVETNNHRVVTLATRLQSLDRTTSTDASSSGYTVDTFLEGTKRILMMPCSMILDGFPKMVRDLARELDKEVEFHIQGGDIELDKRILAELRDPLIHLLRNSLDHGIEKPERRLQAGKSAKARLAVCVAQNDNGLIEITVSDDGAGLDLVKVRNSAVKFGHLRADEAEALSDAEAAELIFLSSVSTSSMITQISGRGLGMAIVKERIERLAGSIKIETKPGAGTTFRMALPVTIATFRGMAVQIGEHCLVIPTLNIDRLVRVKKEDLSLVSNRLMINVDEQLVSVVSLAEAIGFDVARPANSNYVLTVIVHAGEAKVALLIDTVVEEQEYLVKSLGRPLSRVRNVAGVTILSNRKSACILNVREVIRSARSCSTGDQITDSEKMVAPAARKKVLVVDDAHLARTFMQNVLKSAGYYTDTASDGQEALEKISKEQFDLIVSDVEMPRMSGFELTKKVRNHPDLADVPVILVTSLSSQKDRERGVEAGANAYFVKSRYEQTNLLDIVNRLIAD